MIRIFYVAVIALFFQVALCEGKDPDHRIPVDQAFLESHANDLRVWAIARGETFTPCITMGSDFFRGHIETRMNIKSKSGKQILSLPLPKTSVLRFEFSRKDVSAESELEIKFRRNSEVITYAITFRTLLDVNDVWVAD